jgi:hypothetical protein
MRLSQIDIPDKISVASLRAGSPIPPQTFEQIRRRMILDHFKWDSQIGDVTTLANFPLILSANVRDELAALAEAATAELLGAEEELLGRPELFAELGLPRSLRKALQICSASPISRSPRIMRFDFHPTSEGWRVSEVNSDVPGGYTESSNFTKLIAEHFPDYAPAGDPARVWCDSLAHCAGDGVAALLIAPGYMEDFQIVSFLRQRLQERGTDSFIARPDQLISANGRLLLDHPEYRGPLALILRFYQCEWLPKARCDWRVLFRPGATPVVNPPTATLTESKRLPLVVDRLKIPMPVWRSLLPDTHDPRDVDWRCDRWILKTAYCNTGDTVVMPERLTRPQRRKIEFDLFFHPRSWIAQRRFETTAINSPAGSVFPCLGVFTVDGFAAGIYGRFAANPLIDYSAVDVAVLVEDRKTFHDQR